MEIPSSSKPRKSGGARHRQKSGREERMLVGIAQDAGFAAERVPLSGSVGGQRFAGDIVFPLLGRDLCVESKVRGHGFRQLYAWLQNRDALIIRADRHEPLVVVPLRLALEIAKAAERNKS
jgi:Holliday junction resolvase